MAAAVDSAPDSDAAAFAGHDVPTAAASQCWAGLQQREFGQNMADHDQPEDQLQLPVQSPIAVLLLCASSCLRKHVLGGEELGTEHDALHQDRQRVYHTAMVSVRQACNKK